MRPTDYGFTLPCNSFPETDSIVVSLSVGAIGITCYDTGGCAGVTLDSQEFFDKLLRIYMGRLDPSVRGLVQGLAQLHRASHLLAANEAGGGNTVHLDNARASLRDAISLIEAVLK